MLTQTKCSVELACIIYTDRDKSLALQWKEQLEPKLRIVSHVSSKYSVTETYWFVEECIGK